ncbi:uncharacterized protein EI97DRAFT_431821, partial [Westerdykella ornata]
MSSRVLFARLAAKVSEGEACAFCIARQFRRSIHQQVLRNGPMQPRPQSTRPTQSPTLGHIQTRGAASRQAPKPADYESFRKEVNRAARKKWFTQQARDKLINLKPQYALEFLEEFTSTDEGDSGERVKAIAEKEKIQLIDLTNIAHSTWHIPDVKSKKTGELVSSRHKVVARDLFLALSSAGEVNATLHLNRAVFLRNRHLVAREVAGLLSPGDVQKARLKLQEAATKKNAEAISLTGEIWAAEGKKKAARELYESAMKVVKLKPDPKAVRRPGLPQAPPWICLGYSLLDDQTPESTERAKEIFRIGAVEADDPLACFHYALLTERGSGEWLRFMTKAAGSGHLEAMYELAKFYHDVDIKKAASSNDKTLVNALSWLKDWKLSNSKYLADEWFLAAAMAGHKPSMFHLAQEHEAKEEYEEARTWYAMVVEPPSKHKKEHWPDLPAKAQSCLKAMES